MMRAAVFLALAVAMMLGTGSVTADGSKEMERDGQFVTSICTGQVPLAGQVCIGNPPIGLPDVIAP